MGKIKKITIIMLKSILIGTALGVVMTGVIFWDGINRDYEIISHRTIGDIQYTVVSTDKTIKINNIPEKPEILNEMLTSTKYSYKTTLQGKSGRVYRVRSKRLYEYCREHKVVTFEIKDKGMEQYQIFDSEVLNIELIKDV